MLPGPVTPLRPPHATPQGDLGLRCCLHNLRSPGDLQVPGAQLLLEARVRVLLVHVIYRGSRFVTASYGDHWHFMKKLCMTRLLAVPQLKKSADIRADEVATRGVGPHLTRDGRAAHLGREVTMYTNTVICRIAMSFQCSGSENDADEIGDLVRDCLSLAGKLSLGDVLGPWLRTFDFSGNGKKLVSTLVKYDHLNEKNMEEHERKAAYGYMPEWKKDLMDILLEIYKDTSAELKISRNDLKSFLLDLFLAN